MELAFVHYIMIHEAIIKDKLPDWGREARIFSNLNYADTVQ